MATKKLYIGDPCYALPTELYKGLWGNKYEYEDTELIDDNGKKIGVIHGTYFGDGIFVGNNSAYSVDSGTLSILDLSTFDANKVLSSCSHSLSIVECDEDSDFDLLYDNGKFVFTWTLNGEPQCEIIQTNEDDCEDDELIEEDETIEFADEE